MVVYYDQAYNCLNSLLQEVCIKHRHKSCLLLRANESLLTVIEGTNLGHFCMILLELNQINFLQTNAINYT